MGYERDKFEVAGLTVRIIADDDPPNPRTDYDHLATILYMEGSRHYLGDKTATREEIKAITERDDVIWLPVYAYIHSGVTINTTGFSCPWDSGQCGIIYVERETVRKEWGKKRISPKMYQKMIELLKSEVEEFDQFLTGDVWGYVVEDSDGEQLESCWGFYGAEYCIEEAKMVAEHASKELITA